MSSNPQSRSRSRAPVFVLGCVRSGTTLLYHMLLSAGNFAVYRAESSVFNLLEPRFGDLSSPSNKKKLLEAWYESRLFTQSGLDKQEIAVKVMNECRNGGDFLRIVMSEIAMKQGVERWADTTPEHILYLHRIKETIPDALVIHIIRDGRDVALSTDKLGYIRRLPLDRQPAKMAAGLYWEWMVNKGRRDGRDLGADYTEVHFEELIRQPRETLAKIGQFIEQDLDYDQIRRVGIGSVSAPNTSFESESAEGFDPDWTLAERLLARRTRYVRRAGRTHAGGQWIRSGDERIDAARDRSDLRLMRSMYRAYFDTKLFLKAKTPLGKVAGHPRSVVGLIVQSRPCGALVFPPRE